MERHLRGIEVAAAVGGLALAVLAFFGITSIDDIEGQPTAVPMPSTTTRRTPEPEPPATPVPTSTTIREVTKESYLQQVEAMCYSRRGSSGPMPDLNSDPQGFARWLNSVIRSNRAILATWSDTTKPRDGERALNEILALRDRSLTLYSRAADAYYGIQELTGRQFLQNAMQVEEEFRTKAKAYGFQICVGSDAPGQ